MPHEKHRSSGSGQIAVVVVTVSTSRYASKQQGGKADDESGDVAARELGRLGHRLARRELISDEPSMIRSEVERFLKGEDDVLVFLGGTGVSKRDVTIESARPFFEKELDGFGELLRSASFKKVGAASVLTRATAGVASGKLILCLPGSPDAAATALKSFGKEMPHALFVARS
ncbi:MAG: MogA/MoaB family molybdenum cofactor biosynthesis protein [Nitrososphaerota archaeon]|nr:MogA/MoaB family molybdenum cofactor biosynthesis protein [Nitrososphaerota archaeon]